ncbi:MAG TPA: cysteine--tRNA ligase [Steroidobacteraceae bacterium]|nr:cysteine--tRNA ligase [Steroidobacteraceae bacterium]
MLKIHNSLTGEKEVFRPIVPGRVGMYVCGVTVYDYCHIGHARFLVAFDLVRRYLRYRGYAVNYVRNITDIDDKIIQRAAENGEDIGALTARFIRAMDEDCAALGCERPDHEPRATAHIEGIIALIGELLRRELAYVTAEGDVCYAVARFPGYGKLSGKRLEDLRAGARVEVDAGKRDPLDFVLWKRAKPGEPSWPSPWGEGRPGWHIECSAMSGALLGDHFDIHGGGMDLKFPHHENEIAQSCGAGREFANLWMHNGFVNVDSVKMSKSLGNFFTLREVLPRLRHPEVMRAFLLSSHYRGPINYSTVQLEQADAMLTRLYTALRGLAAAPGAGGEPQAPAAALAARARFEAALDDDFNTPEAIAVLQELAREINTARAAGNEAAAAALAAELRRLAAVMGLLRVDAEAWFKLQAPAADAAGAQAPQLDEAQIEARIAERLAARKARDFATADRIRAELAAAGVQLEDQGRDRTIWRRE